MKAKVILLFIIFSLFFLINYYLSSYLSFIVLVISKTFSAKAIKTSIKESKILICYKIFYTLYFEKFLQALALYTFNVDTSF